LTGKEINNYLLDIFKERLNRHSIRFEATNDFINSKTRVFPSTFLPVFINVIDNAIYWLNTQSVSENSDKKIILNKVDAGLTIENNGPDIPTIDRDRIFEFTFSRKLNGRGMGLYISKETLNRDGFDIELMNESPCFIVKRINKEIKE
jgi:sensor histidine kinase regulating citrate/malate metabolism